MLTLADILDRSGCGSIWRPERRRAGAQHHAAPPQRNQDEHPLTRPHPPPQPLLAPRALALQRLPLHFAAALDRLFRPGHGALSSTTRRGKAAAALPFPLQAPDRS